MKKFLNEVAGQTLYTILIITCFVVGFSPWLRWLKYHSINDQTIMVVLDVLFLWILIPINGLIVIFKAIASLFS